MAQNLKLLQLQIPKLPILKKICLSASRRSQHKQKLQNKIPQLFRWQQHHLHNVMKVKTDVIALEIDLQGGTIQNLDLLNYPVEKANTVVNRLRKMIGLSVAEKNTAPVRLFDSSQEKLFVAQSGLIADSGFAAAPNHYTVFTNEQDSYTLQPGQDSLTVPLTWTDNNGLVITKLFTFKRGSYEITLDQKVKNNSGKAWSGRQYSQLLKSTGYRQAKVTC